MKRGLNCKIIEAGGAFGTVLAGTHPHGEEVRFLEKVSKIKKELIKKGVLRDDDGAYLTWSHEHWHLGHAEILLQFPPTTEAVEAINNFHKDVMQIAIDTRYGVPHEIHGSNHDIFGPHASNYHVWQRRLK